MGNVVKNHTKTTVALKMAKVPYSNYKDEIFNSISNCNCHFKSR